MHAFAFLVAPVLAGVAMGQITFEPLGDLAGGGQYSEVWGVSPDGSVTVGASVVGGGGLSPVLDGFWWTSDTGMLPVFGSTSGPSVHAHGASAGGRVIVGVADYGAFNPLGSQAFIWTVGGAPVLIGDLPGGSGYRGIARAVSADGSVVVGIGESILGTQGWRYDVASGAFLALRDVPGGAVECFAYAVSADGRVAVGTGRTSAGLLATRWVAGDDPEGLGYLPTPVGFEPNSAAEAVNADGSVIVGWSRSVGSPQGAEAFLWRPGAGMVGLGDLPGGGFQSWAYGVSGDGTIVVGRGSIAGPCGPFGCGSDGRAFVWDATNGMRDLQAIVAGAGVDLTGWKLVEARGISADGLVIVGNGINPLGLNEGWRVRLGTPRCIGDFTGDGAVDSDDVIAFFGAWDAGDLGADVTSDGGVDSDDVITFFAHWDAGC